MRDIDKRKQAEAEHRRMEEQIRQSQKMEALGALAGGIAHDFNNILTAINGNARLALHDLAGDDPIRTNLAEIHRGAKRATDLVSRILAFSRNEEPALRRLDLRPIVEEAIRLLRATMPAMIEIRFDASGPIPQVLADATQIHQVIMNLGANARDAMSAAGGVLTIAVNEVPKDGRLGVMAPEIRAQTCVRLTVEDTGIGISRENLNRIFEPFFTTKAPGHGTGMGLAMVHGIVRRHGGVILASSQLGRGTKFEIYFPSASASDAQEEVVTPAAVRGHGERILYVDDEEPLVFLASRMLTRLGFEVDGRTDPQQALREFERDPYRWDLVISDLGMPGMSGLDLAAAMQRIRPDVPLMLTSGYVRAEDAERARVLGTGDIIPKPNTVEEMTPIIFSRIAAAREEQRAQAQPNKTHSQN
jgi:nitrogen-specific signal transduction histidine kinase/ActR/RegA family two-component response regulator